jgi:hypothetical protein
MICAVAKWLIVVSVKEVSKRDTRRVNPTEEIIQMLTGSQISQLNFTYFKMHSCYLGIMRGHGNFAFNW